ncbi:aldo/keto reductase [Catenuloplanes atrovinosus]|uniref:Aryl-alcohol dehydrogenase-like predicted oxidoreductase n=1 Tax=Catenuloplanes atrovinosus TaxID=137266 RepID=A0AAE3YMG0_9ACTN|nr:aldo/keto reductase [Catenuloplanes atrovinosus]MDR7274878.1 aryl-alcohol dehydrogenase-like predicted oxidoreductase [Catenuloplanes atrovinosus]
MDYTTLGRTGLQVSRLCLGTMTFGREIGEEASHRLIERFVDAGGTFIDTADGYSDGRSEEIVGSWLRGASRHDVVLATKVRFGSGLNRRGLGRKHILHAIDESLRRLGTDYVDLYQVHMWDYGTPLEETIAALRTVVDAGKVRYLGISNVCGWQLQRVVDACRATGTAPLVSLQPLYNLLDRDAEWELLPVCVNEGLGVLPYSPLRGGWLTGKFRRGPRPDGEDTRIAATPPGPNWTETWENYDNERTWNVVDALLAVADKAGRTPAQTALNWLLSRPEVTAPILGARTPEQLDDNLGALGWSLGPEELARLDDASTRPAPYPYALLDDLRDA